METAKLQQLAQIINFKRTKANVRHEFGISKGPVLDMTLTRPHSMRMDTLIRRLRHMMRRPRLHTATITAHAGQTAQLVRETLIGATIPPMIKRHASAGRLTRLITIQSRTGSHCAGK